MFNKTSSMNSTQIAALASRGTPLSEAEALQLADVIISSRACAELKNDAAKLLKDCPHRRVAIHLAGAVAKPVHETRLIAASALEGTLFPEVRNVLVEAIGLANDAPARLAMVAAQSLKPVNDSDEIQRLKIILEKRGAVYMGAPAKAVCLALTGTKSEFGLNILLDLTLNPFSKFDYTPGRAIHFESPRWGNTAAAEALSITPISRDILERLIERATDANHPARYYALLAICGRSEPEAQGVLRSLATKDQDSEVRSTAAAGIVTSGRPAPIA
jgi:hypothetical protein